MRGIGGGGWRKSEEAEIRCGGARVRRKDQRSGRRGTIHRILWIKRG